VILPPVPTTVVPRIGTGYLEICKRATSAGVTGSFRFTVAGQTADVPVGQCSPALKLPAGSTTITEQRRPGYAMTRCGSVPASRKTSCSLAGGRMVVKIVAGGVSGQTVAIFGNAVAGSTTATTGVPGPPPGPGPWGSIKVCKIFAGGVPPAGAVAFTVGARTIHVQAGYCVLVSPFSVGTRLTIDQIVPPGQRVAAITATPSGSITGTPDLAAGRVVVTVGSGVTEVTFTNRI
jgi:hypothetical protein